MKQADIGTILVASTVAILLTVFEVARVFYVPRERRRKIAFLSWAGSFVIANGILSAVMYLALKDSSAMHQLNAYLAAFCAGASYLVLVRSKFCVINETPIGLEYFYDSAKQFVYKGMNIVSVTALTEEAMSFAAGTSLKDLSRKAEQFITNDNLLKPEEKATRKAWLLRTITDSTSDDDKKVAIATYLLSARM